jgi:hypothetical protein
MDNHSGQQTPVRIVIILSIFVGSLVAYFLSENLEHCRWETVFETFSIDGDHDDHHDEISLSINTDSCESLGGSHWHLAESCVHRLLPPLGPAFPPPKFGKIA